MKKGFVSNMERCIGCNACVIACKQYHGLEPEMKRRKVREMDENIVGQPVRAYLSASCQHCDEPACMKACPTGAYSKREDGVVLHNAEVCIGCRMCQWACPYEAPTFNPVTKKMDKCDFCRERIDAGEQPFCVAGCPMEALEMVDMDEINESDYVSEVKGFVDPSITGANLRVKLPAAVRQVRR
ncbi:MAG: 4Fe-4S dicluster domain-containing protein [Lachnospiraceae bacterium]|nr:4Fe-4S dicluster domain-containing protein [Lachnospiraceae bacterium]